MTVAIHNQQPEHLPEQRGGNLGVRAEQTQWDDNQRAALVHIGIADASPGDQQVFLHYCQRTQLDPFSKQIYMIQRGGKWTIQTAIDGFRVIANRRPEYAGQTGPEWCGEDGVWKDVWVDTRKPPVAARVGVLRSDWSKPIYMTAMFHEFKQSGPKWGTGGGGMPAHMLAKCAEAGALRKAFPHDLGGIYTDDEFGAVDSRGNRRVVIDHAPVTGDELRGITPAQEPASEPAPAAETPASDSPAQAGGDRMTGPQQRKLFALIREHNIADRNDWASGFLGREITSFGQLTQGDAGKLIDELDRDEDEVAWAADAEAPK